MDIPCEQCPVYAICKNKTRLSCSKLHDYAAYLSMDYLNEDDKYWHFLRQTLPHILMVVREGRQYYQYIK